MDTNMFEEYIDNIISSKLSKLNTAFIGKIKKINEDKTIDIEPVLNKVIDDEVQQLFTIPDVEFLQNYSSNGYSALKFDIDDHVLCISLQRDHTDFFETLENAPAATKRKFNIADIVALPFFFSNPKKIEDAIDGWSAKSKTSIKLNLNDTSFFEMENNKVKFVCNGVDVLDILSKTLEALTSATVTTPDGTFPLDNAVTYSQLKAQIDKIKA